MSPRDREEARRPDGTQEPDASATFQTSDAEEVLAAFVARRAKIEPPYAWRCRWLWAGKPTVVVEITKIPNNTRRIRPRKPKADT